LFTIKGLARQSRIKGYYGYVTAEVAKDTKIRGDYLQSFPNILYSFENWFKLLSIPYGGHSEAQPKNLFFSHRQSRCFAEFILSLTEGLSMTSIGRVGDAFSFSVGERKIMYHFVAIRKVDRYL